MLTHPIKPIYNSESEILILGTFPSVKSREQGFFYGHPQNRFWKVIARIYDCDAPVTITEKTAFLLDKHIALWDIIKSCEITGSSDSSIKNVQPNDISEIISNSQVKRIFLNGKKAQQLYKKYIEDHIKTEAVCLPSTSPANASFSEDRLYEVWKRAICND